MQNEPYPLTSARSSLQPRPTVWNGVPMRSRLEAGFASWADAEGLGPRYEPCAFADGTGQYLPDFLLASVRVAGVADPLAVFERMEIIWSSIPDAVLAVAAPGELWVRPPGSVGWVESVWSGHQHPYNMSVGCGPAMSPEWGPWPKGYWNGGS